MLPKQRKRSSHERNRIDKQESFGENHCRLGEQHIEFVKMFLRLLAITELIGLQ
jgi:hypothetical protein